MNIRSQNKQLFKKKSYYSKTPTIHRVSLGVLESEYWNIVDKVALMFFSDFYCKKEVEEVRIIWKFVVKNKGISFKQMDWIEKIEMI